MRFLSAVVIKGMGARWPLFPSVFLSTHTETVGRWAILNDYLLDAMNKTGYFFSKCSVPFRNVKKYYSCLS